MSTTAVVVEIVIIGAQVLLWVALAFISLLGITWFDPMRLKDWVAPISLGLVAASYTVGMVFDTLIASFFAPWSRRSWNMPWTSERHNASPFEMRTYLMLNHYDAFLHQDKLFNQARLLRASILNLLLTGVFSSILYFRYFHFSWKSGAYIVLLLCALVGITFISWTRTLRGSYSNLGKIYQMAVEKDQQGGKASLDRKTT
jgi:hypothetical protein